MRPALACERRGSCRRRGCGNDGRRLTNPTTAVPARPGSRHNPSSRSWSYESSGWCVHSRCPRSAPRVQTDLPPTEPRSVAWQAGTTSTDRSCGGRYHPAPRPPLGTALTHVPWQPDRLLALARFDHNGWRDWRKAVAAAAERTGFCMTRIRTRRRLDARGCVRCRGLVLQGNPSVEVETNPEPDGVARGNGAGNCGRLLRSLARPVAALQSWFSSEGDLSTSRRILSQAG